MLYYVLVYNFDGLIAWSDKPLPVDEAKALASDWKAWKFRGVGYDVQIQAVSSK